jgi:predicted Zn-dependent protease
MQQVALGDVIARSQAFLKEGRPAESIQLLEPALNQYPHNPALWFFYGYALNAVGRKATAALA